MARLFLLLLLAVACGDNTKPDAPPPDAPPPDAPPTRLEASQRIAHAFCVKLVACGVIPEIPVCADHVARDLCGVLQGRCAGAAPDGLAQCEADVVALVCTAPVRLPHACLDAFQVGEP